MAGASAEVASVFLSGLTQCAQHPANAFGSGLAAPTPTPIGDQSCLLVRAPAMAEELGEQAVELARDVGEAVSPVVEQTEELIEGAGEAVEEAAEGASELWQDAREAAGEALDDAQSWIEQRRRQARERWNNLW